MSKLTDKLEEFLRSKIWTVEGKLNVQDLCRMLSLDLRKAATNKYVAYLQGHSSGRWELSYSPQLSKDLTNFVILLAAAYIVKAPNASIAKDLKIFVENKQWTCSEGQDSYDDLFKQACEHLLPLSWVLNVYKKSTDYKEAWSKISNTCKKCEIPLFCLEWQWARLGQYYQNLDYFKRMSKQRIEQDAPESDGDFYKDMALLAAGMASEVIFLGLL